VNSLNGLTSPASDQFFHSAFAHAAVGMAIMDTDGRFLEVNPAFCRIAGYGAEELTATDFLSIGRSSRSLFFVATAAKRRGAEFHP